MLLPIGSRYYHFKCVTPVYLISVVPTYFALTLINIQVRAAEGLYAEELKQRKEVEQELAKEKGKLESIKTQLNEEMEKLRIAQDEKASLERDLLESDLTAKELEQKILSAVELLQSYKREREELQIHRDSALREAEELRKNQSTGRDLTQFFTEFPFREIEEATKNFDPSLKIGEGGYGSIFRANLRHTMVAIKILHSDSSQGPSEFQQEVNSLFIFRLNVINHCLFLVEKGFVYIFIFILK